MAAAALASTAERAEGAGARELWRLGAGSMDGEHLAEAVLRQMRRGGGEGLLGPHGGAAWGRREVSRAIDLVMRLCENGNEACGESSAPQGTARPCEDGRQSGGGGEDSTRCPDLNGTVGSERDVSTASLLPAERLLPLRRQEATAEESCNASKSGACERESRSPSCDERGGRQEDNEARLEPSSSSTSLTAGLAADCQLAAPEVSFCEWIPSSAMDFCSTSSSSITSSVCDATVGSRIAEDPEDGPSCDDVSSRPLPEEASSDVLNATGPRCDHSDEATEIPPAVRTPVLRIPLGSIDPTTSPSKLSLKRMKSLQSLAIATPRAKRRQRSQQKVVDASANCWQTDEPHSGQLSNQQQLSDWSSIELPEGVKAYG